MISWRVRGAAVGSLQPRFAERLQAAFPRDFVRADDGGGGALDLVADDPEAAAAAAAALLRAEGHVPGWRDELYDVVPAWGAPPLLRLERAACTLFGVRQRGTYASGLDGAGRGVWLGVRAASKPTHPGKLDCVAAGGLPAAAASARANMVKECGEEAGLPPAAAEVGLTATGAVGYEQPRPRGWKRATLLTFDLRLPEGFEPRPADGEVERFELWGWEELREALLPCVVPGGIDPGRAPAFKPSIVRVKLDLLMRHGYITDSEVDDLGGLALALRV